MSTTRILVQTVGTGRTPSSSNDRGNPVWEALAFAVNEVKPDVLIHLCTETTSTETLPRVMELLNEYGWKGTHVARVDADPNHVEELALAYDGYIQELQQKYDPCELHIDFTSGTKAMSAAVAVAGLARGAVKLHYATGPRDDGGRATATDKIIALSSDQLIGKRRLDEAGLLFDLGQFEAACRIAKDVQPSLSDPLLCAKAGSLMFMAEVCNAWQLFDWGKAFSKLREYNKQPQNDHLQKAGWDVEHLGELVRFLKHARESGLPATNERLIDLFANAERCIGAGRYDDAVARLYRIVEYIGQSRLATRKIDATEDVLLQDLERNGAPQTASRLRARSKSDKIRLGVRDVIEVLDEMGDTLGRDMATLYFGDNSNRSDQPQGRLAKCLYTRNQSLMAHGTNPIAKTDADSLCGIVEELLRKHVEESWDSLLALARFPECPWAPTQPLPELTIANS